MQRKSASGVPRKCVVAVDDDTITQTRTDLVTLLGVVFLGVAALYGAILIFFL